MHLPVIIVVALQRSTSHFAPSLLLFSKSVSTKSWRIPDDRSPLLPARDLSPLLGFLYFPCYSILLKQRHLLSLTVVSNSTPSQLTPILFHLLSSSFKTLVPCNDRLSWLCLLDMHGNAVPPLFSVSSNAMTTTDILIVFELCWHLWYVRATFFYNPSNVLAVLLKIIPQNHFSS